MTLLPTPEAVFARPEYHDLIGLIYDGISGPEGFYPFLQRFIEVFHGHSAVFSIYDTNAQAVIGAWEINIPQHALEFYAEHVSHQDMLVETALAVTDQGESRFVASNLDFGDDGPERRVSTRANEWLASYGAKEACGAIAFRDKHYLNFFGIQRAAYQPDFTREELAVFDFFLPHIKRAVGLYTKMTALAAGFSPELLALNQLQQGVLICDSSFRVLFKNQTAERILERNPGIRLSQEGLLTFDQRSVTRRFSTGLSSAVKASLNQNDSGETVLSYRHNAQNLSLVLSPLLPTTDVAQNRGGAIISLYDWSARPTIDPLVLRQFFDLSRAEANVAALLAEGNSLAEVAEAVNRSRETVKTHLKSVFRKTNTSRQGELVALLSTTTPFV